MEAAHLIDTVTEGNTPTNSVSSENFCRWYRSMLYQMFKVYTDFTEQNVLENSMNVMLVYMVLPTLSIWEYRDTNTHTNRLIRK